jgi:hypothetical protein
MTLTGAVPDSGWFFNHCGDGLPVSDVLLSGAVAYKDWFHARGYPLTRPLNYSPAAGPLPAKLNHTYRPVQEFIFSVARYWLEETA